MCSLIYRTQPLAIPCEGDEALNPAGAAKIAQMGVACQQVAVDNAVMLAVSAGASKHVIGKDGVRGEVLDLRIVN